MKLPLIAIGSLETLIEVARQRYAAGELGSIEGWDSAHLSPMIDARRMEVYNAIFSASGKALTQVKAEIIDESSFAQWRGDAPFIILGDGAAKCHQTLPWSILVDVKPSARGLARMAEELFNRGESEDIAYFEPLYLKDFIVTTAKKKLF